MKFAAVLRDCAAELPDTEDLFKKYKQLKKSLKRITAAPDAPLDSGNNRGNNNDASSGDGSGSHPAEAKNKESALEPAAAAPSAAPHTTADEEVHFLLDPAMEAEFLRVITADVRELNDRYIEKEEDNVIAFGALEEAVEGLEGQSHDAKAAVYRAFVDFHGELLMLLHWSILAYTGLVKILKKHRKRTGAPLHAPHLENLLSQPFCSVEVTCGMIRQSEEYVARLAKDLGVTPPHPTPLAGLINGRPGSETLTSSEAAAKVAAAAAAVAAAGHAVHVEAQQGGGEGDADLGRRNHQKEQVEEEREKGSGLVGHKRTAEDVSNTLASGGDGGGGDAVHVPVGEFEVAGGAMDNRATRRVRAALNVWQQLQSNASTPSTMIAASGGAPRQPPLMAPSNMTDSSVA